MTQYRRARGCWALLVLLLVLAAPVSAAARSNPLAARGMWIWYVSASNHGNFSSIVAKARQYGISTLMIKSSDGSSMWSQFSPGLVSRLHANGLRVCAWQYVYGIHPVAEARLGAAAVHDGADCLLIDAESQYEGKYISAQTYVTKLRSLIGGGFPVALAGFPYVDFHPAFPYSVFLGPGGAQYNVPQMYWKDIGVTVDTVYAHTYLFNRIYQRPISPLGQVYSNPPARQILRFRQLSRAYGALGVSWWDWQEASAGGWSSVARRVGSLSGLRTSTALATIKSRSRGDLVVWAQQHLLSAGYTLPVDGGFGQRTAGAVRAFQLAHGLTVDGVIGTATWQALLRFAPAHVVWTSHGATVASAASRGVLRLPVPESARLKAKRNEIAGAGGRG
jgi:hypothetical protein